MLHRVQGKRRRHAVGVGGVRHFDKRRARFVFQVGRRRRELTREAARARGRRCPGRSARPPTGRPERARPRARLPLCPRWTRRASTGRPPLGKRPVPARLRAFLRERRRDRPRRRPTRRWPRRTTRGSSGRGPRLETRSGTATTPSCASGPQPSSARREWHPKRELTPFWSSFAKPLAISQSHCQLADPTVLIPSEAASRAIPDRTGARIEARSSPASCPPRSPSRRASRRA